MNPAGREEPAMTSKPRTWQLMLQHLTAVIVGLVIFGLVFAYTGDSDLLVAITGGMAGSLFVYLLVQLRSATRERE
jgi:hypothetical protein